MKSGFSVVSEHFSGPLDLLLELVEEKKLHINDIALAAVADSFLSHIKQSEELPKDEAAHFLVVASTLMLIKSTSLLPGLSLSDEETTSIHDLELRLALFQKIKEGAELLRLEYGKRRLFFRNERPPQILFSPSNDLTIESLHAALSELVVNLPKKETLPEIIVRKVISLEEVISSLMDRVSKALSMSFKDFVGGSKEKVDIIVSFLGMLELVKQGAITVSQEESGGEIRMESTQVSTPHYS